MSTRRWPEPVERVARLLRDARVEARVEEFEGGTPTATEAAEAAGCDLAQIVKSLVFACDGRWILVMVPGDRRADRAKIAKEAGCRSVKAAAREELERATGFRAGGVAPFPLPGVEIRLLDRTLLAHEVVWVGAGSERHMAVLAPADLVRLAGARAVDVVGEEGQPVGAR